MPSSEWPFRLFDLTVFRKVDQRFGMLGAARLIRLIELVLEQVADSDQPLTAVMAWGDFMTAMSCNSEQAAEFLAYCDHARAIDRADVDGRLSLTLVGELAARFRPADSGPRPVPGRVLFETDKQWAEWFKGELNCPPYLANDPSCRRIFRRWCATNVTVDEMEAAIERAMKAGEAPSPAVLHDHLRAYRQAKIERASI